MVVVIIISHGISDELCRYVKNNMEDKATTFMVPIDYNDRTSEDKFASKYYKIIDTCSSQFDQIVVFMDMCNRFTHIITKSASDNHAIIFIPTILLPMLIDIVGRIEHCKDKLMYTDIMNCIRRYRYHSNLSTMIMYDGDRVDCFKEEKDEILKEGGYLGMSIDNSKKLIGAGNDGVENTAIEFRRFFVDHYQMSTLEQNVVVKIPLKNGVNRPIVNGIERYNKITYIAAVNNLISSGTLNIEYVYQRTIWEEFTTDKTRFRRIADENVIGFLQAIDSENLYIIPGKNFKKIVPSDSIPYLKAYMRFIRNGNNIDIITWDVYDSRISDKPAEDKLDE